MPKAEMQSSESNFFKQWIFCKNMPKAEVQWLPRKDLTRFDYDVRYGSGII